MRAARNRDLLLYRSKVSRRHVAVHNLLVHDVVSLEQATCVLKDAFSAPDLAVELAPTSRRSGKSVSTLFVTFPTEEGAEKALQAGLLLLLGRQCPVVPCIDQEQTTCAAKISTSISTSNLAKGATLAMSAARAEGSQLSKNGQAKRVECPLCGREMGAGRSLRMHLMAKHSLADEEALFSTMRAARQCSPSGSISASTSTTARARDSQEPWLMAARNGDVEALRQLSTSGWHSNTCADRHGSLAIHWAAGRGHLEAVKYLVSEGCAANIPVTKGRRCRKQPLHWASRVGANHVVDWLLGQHCVSPNDVTKDGSTPLHFAVYGGNLSTVQLLCCRGANIHALNTHGCGAAAWAALGCAPEEVCQFLHSNGVDFSIVNNQGHSFWHKAALRGSLALLHWCNQHCALPLSSRGQDIGGHMPSELASLSGFPHVAEWLLTVESQE
jgi:hypothetical protein